MGKAMHDVAGRERKALTMVAVLKDHLAAPTHTLDVLNVGGSTGIIDNILASQFRSVLSIDIDKDAVQSAKQNYQRGNLTFQLGDAMNMETADNTFHVVICAQVYEHVPDATKMMREIFRVLKPGGVCYFAANNRLMWNEPHYNLPLLSVIPRPLAHLYIRLFGKAKHYHELHLTYWGLRRLVRDFQVHDYTGRILEDPHRFHAAYMVKPGTIFGRIARMVVNHLYWLTPGYIWLLSKPVAKN